VTVKNTIEAAGLNVKISLAIFLAIAGQLCTGVWFAAKIDSRVAGLERQMVAITGITEENRAWQIDQRIRVWERVDTIDKDLGELAGDVKALVVQLTYLNNQLERLQNSPQK
jgi:hypothetical protein